MTLFARYLILLALVTALFVSIWGVTTYLLSPSSDLPQAGLSDGGLSNTDGWSWNG